MIEKILDTLGVQLLILAIIYFAVLAVIFLDLWSGIRKAKARGEYSSSAGLRRTVDKISKYFNMIFVITIIDAVQMLGIWLLNDQAGCAMPILPFLTFIGAMFVGFIELKSIYEKNSDKEKAKMQEAAKLASHILKNRDTQDVLAAFMDYMKTEKPKENG